MRRITMGQWARGRAGPGPRRAICLLVIATATVGCAASQVVPLTIDPAPAEVFVDGRPADRDGSGALSLRTDRGHVVLVRRAGYRSEQVVIESVEAGGVRRLEPARISVRLVPEQRRGQRVEVELDGLAEERPPAPAATPEPTDERPGPVR